MRDYAAWITLTLILTPVLFVATTTAGDSPFSFEIGTGYEFISQEFFADSLVQTGQDSLELVTRLKTTYLDDYKAFLTFGYAPGDGRRLRLRSRFEQTPEFLRTKLFGDFRPELAGGRLALSGEFDWRERHDGNEEDGDDYLFGQGRARWYRPVSEHVQMEWQARGDVVVFDSTSNLSYDHYRLGGQGGIGVLFDNFSTLDIDLFMLRREVPDSNALSYTDVGGEATYLGFLGQSMIDAYGRVERRDYGAPNGEDDLWRFELELDNKVTLGSIFYARQDFEGLLTLYDSTDLVNYDFALGRLRLLGGYERNGFTAGGGWQFEFQAELDPQEAFSDDYIENGFVAEIDYFHTDRVFASVESVFGYRSLETESELQTSFLFERVNLLGDARIVRGLRFNILLSAEWEWHENESEDNAILLLTTSLRYEF